MLARFWRGEITLRKLRVLIENLPPLNARAAQQNDGVWWTDQHSLLNLIEFRLREGTAATYSMGGAKPKRPKYNPKPWKKANGTIGDRGGRSSAEAKAYLDSLAPPKVSKPHKG